MESEASGMTKSYFSTLKPYEKLVKKTMNPPAGGRGMQPGKGRGLRPGIKPVRKGGK